MSVIKTHKCDACGNTLETSRNYVQQRLAEHGTRCGFTETHVIGPSLTLTLQVQWLTLKVSLANGDKDSLPGDICDACLREPLMKMLADLTASVNRTFFEKTP